MTETHKSSQTMTPIKSYSTVLMGWKRTTYLENIETLNCGYHGGKGKTEYFELKGLANIDIDNEEDFRLFRYWTLLGSTILSKTDWLEVLEHTGYTGDYKFNDAKSLELIPEHSDGS